MLGPVAGLRARFIFAGGSVLMSSWLGAAPLDVVRECAATASPSLNGVKALEAACPGLQDALAATGFDQILIDGWQKKINAHVLAELDGLAERYARSQRHAPDTATLRVALDSLQAQAPHTSSWWQNFKTWVKNWLSRSDSALASWLNRLLDRWSAHTEPSAILLRIITYCLTAVVAIAAVLIVVREIRALRLGARARRVDQTKPADGNTAQRELEPELIPGFAADAVSVLLRALVARLMQLGRLRGDRSLTHRELIVRSVFENPEQRAAFADVACAAESNYYGPRGRVAHYPDAVQQRGAALLAQLAQSKAGA